MKEILKNVLEMEHLRARNVDLLGADVGVGKEQQNFDLLLFVSLKTNLILVLSLHLQVLPVQFFFFEVNCLCL